MDLFHRWVDAMFSQSSELSMNDRQRERGQALQDSLRPMKEMSAYVAEHAARRRREPREDLITRLVQAEVDETG